MKHPIVRIQSAKLENFRNVEQGEIRFPCSLKPDMFESMSDIVGLYGQNGSGKTAFIRALSVLETLLSGEPLSPDMANYITVGTDFCKLTFLFSIQTAVSLYRTSYEVTLGRKKASGNHSPAVITKEKLQYSMLKSDRWSPVRTVIDFNQNSSSIFSPRSQYTELTKGDPGMRDDLRLAKRDAQKHCTSFLFSKDTLNALSEVTEDKNPAALLAVLSHFGRNCLYIIDNRGMGLVHASFILPFHTEPDSGSTSIVGAIPLQLDGPSLISSRLFPSVCQVTKTMNLVLSQIVPDLNLTVTDLGKQLMEDGSTGTIIEFYSSRGVRKVPLRYESDGIKKIISVLHMIMFMYNNPSMTLAIDELDSGIYEYLLGEILKIIEQTGKGQLIFTSHNLRPLETISQQSIIFTTTNPTNRYVRLKKGKTLQNLRDSYYHDLVLGGQKECIYEPTNSFAISRAFRLAGADYES